MKTEKNTTGLRKNSRNLMNSAGVSVQNKSFFSGEDVCKIIEIAAKSGANTLKCGSLEVYFGETRPATSPAPEPTISRNSPENVIQEQQKIEEQALEQAEVETREDQIAELLLTDPVKAEELMRDGDLQKVEESDEDGE